MTDTTDGPRFGGRLALDLTWTLRYRAVAPTETLVSADDLRDWLAAADLPTPDTATEREMDDVRVLREAIHSAASALIDGSALAQSDLDTINGFAAAATPVPFLDGTRRRGVHTPRGVLPAALSLIARDAIDLLADGDDGRLRRCEGPHCSLLFHDDSRPGTRRWCSTARCGNRVNTRAARARRRAR